MTLNKEEIAQLYHKRAKHYNFSANTYYLLGIREFAYRKMAVRELALEPGDTVVEIGCGTGLNFSLLRRNVGPQGRIIGVDMTSEMLARADQRIRHNHWSNVSLIQSDAAAFEFPQGVDGVISTFALTLIPEYDNVIKKAASALSKGKRLVILDLRVPDRWPTWMVKLFVILTRPFGVTMDLGERRLWQSVDRHLKTVSFKQLYFGAIYICVGQAG